MQISNRFARLFGRVAASLLVVAAAMPGAAFAQLNQQQNLVSSLPVASAHLGSGVSIFGDTAVVGAPNDNAGAGFAYVYTRSGTTWTQVAVLAASDATAGDKFGSSVSISNGNIAVGAPGHGSNAGAVYTFTGSGATWTQNPQILTANVTANGHLGTSVSIQGFTVAAGAPNAIVGGKANVGVAVVFKSNDSGATWTSVTFRANGGQARTNGLFGTSVSLSGSTIAVGVPGYHTGNKQNSGAMFIFVNNGGSWTQQTNLRPANVSNYFAGTAVSISGNTAALGTPGGNNGKGAVYMYTRSGTAWSAAGTLTASDGANGDQFGASVAASGALVVVGAPAAASGAGKAYEYGVVGGNYTQVNTLVATDNAAGDNFGASVGFDAGSAIVGAPLRSNTQANDGSAYVFVIQQASVTTITCFSSDPNSCVPQEPGLTGVPYTVFVHVDHDIGGSGTPAGSVNLDDGNGGTCTIAALDGAGNGSCQVTSTYFGTLTMTANYNGNLAFSPSTGTLSHTITGNHLVFNPKPPVDVTQGDQISSVTIEVQNGANAVITSDNSTVVTFSVTDSCGNPEQVVAQGTVTAGTITFSAVGPRFYTVGGGLAITATSNNGTVTDSSNLAVVANADLMFADGYEDCRL